MEDQEKGNVDAEILKEEEIGALRCSKPKRIPHPPKRKKHFEVDLLVESSINDEQVVVLAPKRLIDYEIHEQVGQGKH